MLFSASIYSFFSAIRKGEPTPLSSIAKAKELASTLSRPWTS